MNRKDTIYAWAGRTAALRWGAPFLVAALTVVAFLPVLQNGFVDLDDDQTIFENPYYRGLGWTRLGWMFTTFHEGHYQPLTWVTLGIDYLLWGMNPFGYHLTNLLLHAANAVVFYFLCARLLSMALSASSGDAAVRVGAGIAALLFAVHPLRVESVAWVTERRDVLSGLFFLLTLLCYVRATMESGRSHTKWMGVTLALYVLSLLSKAVGMTLPVALCVLDVYPLRRLGNGPGEWFGPGARKVWREKMPFLLPALGAAALALWAQSSAGTLATLAERGAIERLAQIFYGLVFYLWKTIAPAGLIPLYEVPRDFNPWQWVYALSGLLVAAITAALIFFRRRWPAGLAVWLYYAALVAPVSGIAQAGPQLVADRYSYLSCLGWAILAGGGLVYFWRRRMAFAYPVAAATIVVAWLGVLTLRQAEVWHDSERLYRYVLAVNPESRIAHNNLGNILGSRGQLDEAIEHYRRSVEVNPGYAIARANLAVALSARGETEESVRQYREVIRRSGPAQVRVMAANNLALLLHGQGRLDEAMESYRQAIALDLGSAEAYNNLGSILASRGDVEAALAHYRAALSLAPHHAAAHFNLGVLLGEKKGKTEEAIGHLRQAVQSETGDASAHFYLGKFLAAAGNSVEAADHFREALRIEPGLSEAGEGLKRLKPRQ